MLDWCLEDPEDQSLALCGQKVFGNWHNLSLLFGSNRSCNAGGDNPLQKEILDITGLIAGGSMALVGTWLAWYVCNL